ncbi:tyrosine-type recombinase/integrase [Hydrogenophaga sp. D2P1]|jgi:site-specific recombinase XerD|uniref:Tyrosine-type recombinase/integrase n=1 Tax=Hydrogenophaga aromaticivorans TaxID=2610898 RepID=A0A7Y8H182_9BURK|nr:site-specific integrase [Hydrogenophaga aromaticivorans]NWF44730.1 tyrosine-type recombinase/integrase [Hydrogenophaga aromaticivorans]NWF48636.1 tyrosine-type recombinase/integrase [Hydrogenophaga aromaticivorans]
MDICTPTPSAAVSPLRQRMLDDMRMRQFAEHTQDGYIRAVRKLSTFLGRSPHTATAEDLRRFQLHLVDTGTGPVTINATITGLKFFFDITLGRPELMLKMTNVAVPRKLPVILSPEEVGRLIAAAPNLKHQAAMSVAYGAGLRVSEVVSLKVGDIDGERMTLRVEQGKGRKDRYAMLSPVLLERLRAWWRLGHAQGKIRHGGWLFPGLDPTDHVTPRQLNRAVHLAAATAGIDKRITPHGLRHAFATHLLEQKVDIRVIQVLLGHKRLDTTTLYAAVATDLLRRVISPLDHTSAKPAGEPAPEPAPQPPAL